MTEMIDTEINGRWHLKLPDYRAARPEWKTGWEAERLASIYDHVKPTDIILDVGTEEGDMSALMASWVPEGGIYLFEPNPRVWPTIKAIWDANNIKPPLGYFVGFASTRTILHPPNEDTRGQTLENGWPECSVGKLTGKHGDRRLTNRTNNSTPQTTIDVFCINRALKPNIITMDIDGGEFEALKGAENILRTCKPLLYISVHPDYMHAHFGQFEYDLHLYLKALGYGREHLKYDHEHHWLYEYGGDKW